MPTDMKLQAKSLQKVLTARDLTHLRVVKRGQTLTITNESHPEVRLSLVAPGKWLLDFRHHSNRWQPTPFVGDIAEMVELALSMGRLQHY
jgi:hypothetical protein